MSTTATAPDLSIKTENVQYQVWVKSTPEGKVDEKSMTYRAVNSDDKKEEEAVKKLTEAGYQLAKLAQIKAYSVGTTEALHELINDPEEEVNIINRGIANKYNQKIKEYLTDFDTDKQDFVNAAVEDVFDSVELLREATKRKVLTQAEKIVKGLRAAGLSDEQIAAMVASLQASSN